jgi:thymidylate kinase
MSWFDADVLPCVEFFRSNENCEFIEINGEQTIEQVSEEIMKKVFNK